MNDTTPSPTPPYGLSELLARCHLIWRRHLARLYQPLGVSLKQLHVLGMLQIKPRSPAELADMLYADKPTVSVIIKNLEKNGWVARVPDAADKRRFMLALTEKGRTKNAEIEGLHQAQAGASLFSCLEADEKAQLRRLLAKVYHHACETLQPEENHHDC